MVIELSEKFESYVKSQHEALLQLSMQDLNDFLFALDSLVKSESTLWVVGNGGAAATASHLVADFNKTVRDYGGNGIRCVALSEMVSLHTAASNDISFEEGFASAIRYLAKPGDGVLFLSVSGKSPNIVSAVREARKLELGTFCIFGKNGNELAKNIDFPLKIQSTDYQIVENIQLAILHFLVKALSGGR